MLKEESKEFLSSLLVLHQSNISSVVFYHIQKKTYMSDLFISSNKLSHSCSDVVNLFLKLKINGWVSSNKTVRCDEQNCWTENGCQLKILMTTAKKNETDLEEA